MRLLHLHGFIIFMGTERLELSRVAPLAPQASAYTNSATSPNLSNSTAVIVSPLTTKTLAHYYFGCDLLFAFFVAAVFVLLAGVLPVFAFVLVAGAAMGAMLGCGVAGAAGAGVGVGSVGADCSTEREPVSVGNESTMATSMKAAAAAMVILASKVCVP